MSIDLREIAIGDLDPGQNPRTIFVQRELDELAANVKADGILQPLEVRAKGKRFEIIFGERRFRAAKMAGLAKVPAIVVDIDAKRALEHAVVENEQRANMHPLDTARGYQALMEADKAYTVDAVAARIGKSKRHVYRLLQLLKLTPTAQQAFAEERITAAHAQLLAGVPAKLQPDALKACFFRLYDQDDQQYREALAPVQQLEDWIERNVALDVRGQDVQILLPEIAEAVAKADKVGTRVLELSREHSYKPRPTSGPLPATFWHAIRGKSDRCDHAEVGIVVKHGPRRALEVCATDGCPKHYPAPKPAPSSSRSTSGASGSASTRHKPTKAEKEAADRARKEEAKRHAKVQRWNALEPKLQRILLERAKKLKGLTDRMAAEIAKDFMYDIDDEIEKAIGKVTAATFPAAVVMALVGKGYIPDAPAFLKQAKTYGFDLSKDLKQLEKELDEEPASKKAASTRKKGRGR